MIVVAGEALIDFTPALVGEAEAFIPRPGGSPLNVAVGLARLGIPAGFLGRLSTDFFGQRLKQHLTINEVSLRFLQQGSEPSTLAFVSLPEGGEPQYAFYGSVDAHLAAAELPPHFEPEISALHFGSISLVREPGASALEHLMQRESGQRYLSLDPNVRPVLIPNREAYLRRLEQWVAVVNLVKVSQSDLSWLYPTQSSQEVSDHWLTLGSQVVVVTQGSQGSVGFTRTGSISIPSQPISVVDTIGAGDAFMSGLLASLHEQECLGQDRQPPDLITLETAMQLATQVGAFTCQRPGADPPRRSELRDRSGVAKRVSL